MSRAEATDWGDLAEAVVAAAYRIDERTAGGFATGTGTGTGTDASARAAAVLDAAIRVVEHRRRTSHRAPPDAPLDEAVFDRQALTDLVEFLRHARRGLLTGQEIGEEARMWRQLLAAWPATARDASTVTDAVDLLCALPDPEPQPGPPTPAEPVNELERALAAVTRDESARPQLWQALFDGEIVLPVVAYELTRPEGANFQFLSAPLGNTPMVMGFTTEERFDALLPPGAQVSRVNPLGRDLPRFWPEGHWLMINPGYGDQVVLSPWEIGGLPDGSRTELPHPRATRIEPPEDDDPRWSLLVEALGDVPRVDHVVWARVRPARRSQATRWQDVLVVTARPSRQGDPDEPDEPDETDDTDEAVAANALSAMLPPEQFRRALVLGRQARLGHPFIEEVVATGRPVQARPSSPCSGQVRTTRSG